ncbi:MAG: hypothetical protein AAF846_08210 [Chloroflexota bacterium]
MVASPNFSTRLHLVDSAPSSFQRLLNWIVQHTWYVHSTSHIHMVLTPQQTYQLLETATKPSVNRLGLRKLFARGRRYFIRARSDGSFQMMTTNKVWWHRKRRTEATAILSAEFEHIEGDTHRLKTRTRVKLRYLLGQFFLPTFISSIIIFLDWSPIFIVLSVLGLYAFSWASHRLGAMLESHEITFFIETVLNDYTPPPAPQLATGDDVVIDDFTVEWDRYVEKQRNR